MADTAPATPDLALAALQELPLPDPIPYIPQTPGWGIVGALLLCVLAVSAWRWYKRRLANRYRVDALRELADIEQMLRQQPLAAGRLPALVKRVALASAPRAMTATLSGDDWLQWLDRTLPRAGFLEAPGRLLPQLAYGSPQAADPDTLRALLALLRRWIPDHRVHV